MGPQLLPLILRLLAGWGGSALAGKGLGRLLTSSLLKSRMPGLGRALGSSLAQGATGIAGWEAGMRGADYLMGLGAPRPVVDDKTMDPNNTVSYDALLRGDTGVVMPNNNDTEMMNLLRENDRRLLM